MYPLSPQCEPAPLGRDEVCVVGQVQQAQGGCGSGHHQAGRHGGHQVRQEDHGCHQQQGWVGIVCCFVLCKVNEFK